MAMHLAKPPGHLLADAREHPGGVAGDVRQRRRQLPGQSLAGRSHAPKKGQDRGHSTRAESRGSGSLQLARSLAVARRLSASSLTTIGREKPCNEQGAACRAALELGRALPLPAAAAHDVQAERDTGQNKERKRLHFHSESLLGFIRVEPSGAACPAAFPARNCSDCPRGMLSVCQVAAAPVLGEQDDLVHVTGDVCEIAHQRARQARGLSADDDGRVEVGRRQAVERRVQRRPARAATSPRRRRESRPASNSRSRKPIGFLAVGGPEVLPSGPQVAADVLHQRANAVGLAVERWRRTARRSLVPAAPLGQQLGGWQTLR